MNNTKETIEQARKRIANQLALEIAGYQQSGMPNEVLGLTIYNALIDIRLQNEILNAKIARLNIQLGKDIAEIVKNSQTARPK